MRKPDIFDEIILFLKEASARKQDLDIPDSILRPFFAQAEAREARHAERRTAPSRPESSPAACFPSSSSDATRSLDGLSWEQLQERCLSCTDCVLAKTRKNVVFGSGNPHADLMFIVGEGPGADEDEQGLPFVGRAGELLTRMIQAMKFSREDVYIANVVKCRPPNNRNPSDDETAACIGYLHAQIQQVNPKVIVLLGAVPLLALLGMKGVTRLRGNWLDFNGFPVMPTLHPAFLLRDPTRKPDVWRDLQEVMRRLGS